ncbi:hypothetical protein [Marinobacter gelidimuriae]|uniref:hypothetical protein n=1 Tax=Marinobacter gelidimuriae TaxID=2739064 RepID=UPI0012DDEAF6|nr:hypothetical protein [Marinobacter gelidimuriae]
MRLIFFVTFSLISLFSGPAYSVDTYSEAKALCENRVYRGDDDCRDLGQYNPDLLHYGYFGYFVVSTNSGPSNTFKYYWSTAPEPCVSPDYIDEFGSCVEPKSVCFITLGDMRDTCLPIGKDDPDDGVPEGCVVNSDGMEMCLTDDPACYEVDGKTVCPEPDNVCGTKNGAFSCVDPVVEGCGSFNGEQVCFTPDGDKVEPESPDHPKNGGNLDGDDTNDVIDSRPPDQGGDPSNQADSGTTTDGSSSEKQQKLGNKELSEINKGIDGLSGDIKNLEASLTAEGSKTPGDYESDISEAGDAAIAGTGVDELMETMSDNPMSGTKADSNLELIGDNLLGIIPKGSCAPVGMSYGLASFEITCDDTAVIRDLLGFLFYAYTLIFMFNIVTQPKSTGGS